MLYSVYYTGFALFFGFLGHKFNREISVWSVVLAVVFGTAFTAIFTLLDDVITPFFFGFGREATVAYFYSSLPFMLTQCICAVISSAVLFIPICKTLSFAVNKEPTGRNGL